METSTGEEDQGGDIQNFSGDLDLARYVFAPLLGVSFVYLLVVLVMVYRRRRIQPLAARPFRATMGFLLSTAVFAIELGWRYVLRESHSCFWVMMCGFSIITLGINMFIYRLWVLWFQFKCTEEKARLSMGFAWQSQKVLDLRTLPGSLEKQCSSSSCSNTATSASNPSPSSSTSDLKSGHVDLPVCERSRALDSLPTVISGSIDTAITSRGKPVSSSKDSRKHKSSKATWYLDRPHLGSDAFLLKTLGTKAAVEYIVLVSPLFYNASQVWQESLGDPGALCPSFWQWQLWAFLAVIGYDAIAMLFAAWKFTKVRDGFYLKTESRLMGITSLVGAVGWYIIEIQDFNIEVFPLSALWLNLMLLLAFSLSGTYPLLLTYRRSMNAKRSFSEVVEHSIRVELSIVKPIETTVSHAQDTLPFSPRRSATGTLSRSRGSAAAGALSSPLRESTASHSHQIERALTAVPAKTPMVLASSRRHSRSRSQRRSLDATLRDPAERELLRDHLKLEFSIENLMFWEAVESFRLHYEPDNPQGNLAHAVHLHTQFLDNGSALEVNLDSQTVIDVEAQLAEARNSTHGSVSISIFDRAQARIFQLIRADSYPRFITQRDRVRTLSRGQSLSRVFNFN